MSGSASAGPESANSRTTKRNCAIRVSCGNREIYRSASRKIHLYWCEANEEVGSLYYSEAEPLFVRINEEEAVKNWVSSLRPGSAKARITILFNYLDRYILTLTPFCPYAVEH